ncbi:MAG: S-layer homology domain-containing protein [Firmicutes bacterium]|nr:S-layer homology domain-containing protein [Bacillota bacterium]
MKKLLLCLLAICISLPIIEPAFAMEYYTESLTVTEVASTRADTFTNSGILEIRNNRQPSNPENRGQNLREAYVKININDFGGIAPIRKAQLRLTLQVRPSNTGVVSEQETPTCDVYAFGSLASNWNPSNITYSSARGEGVRPNVNELDENPLTYEESKELGYLSKVSFDSTSALNTAYYFDITPFVNDLITEGQSEGTIVLMQAGGSISRESAVMQFYNLSADIDSFKPAVLIASNIATEIRNQDVANFKVESVPSANIRIYNNAEDANVTCVGIIKDGQGNVYDTATSAALIPAMDTAFHTINLAFTNALPPDITGFRINIYSFYDIENMHLINNPYVRMPASASTDKRNARFVGFEEFNHEIIDTDLGILRVSGKTIDGNADCAILFRIYPTDSAKDYANENQVYGMVYSGQDGRFSIDEIMPGTSGRYAIAAGGLNVSQPYFSNDFLYFSTADTQNVFKKVNETKTPSDLKAVLTGEDEIGNKNYQILNIKNTAYLSLLNSGEGLIEICEYILRLRFEMEDDAFLRLNDFSKAFDEAMDMYVINNSNVLSDTLAETILNRMAESNVLQKIYNSEEVALSADLKNEILLSVLGGDYKNINELVESFDVKTILLALKKSLYQKASIILKHCEQYTEYNLENDSTFSVLSDTKKAAVLKKFTSANINSPSEIKGLMKKWIDKEAENNNDPPSTNSSSDGHAKGGSSVSYYSQSSVAEQPKAVAVIADDIFFDDLDGFEWAEEYIKKLSESGVVQGDGASFFPQREVTRGEYVKMLIEAFNLLDPYAECEFTDTQKNDWHYPYIASAKNHNIITGMSSSLFGADYAISRQDMSVMAYRLASRLGIKFEINTNIDFTDSGLIEDYAITAVYAFKSVNIISGMPNGDFAPNLNTKRAEAAKVICTLMEYANKFIQEVNIDEK